MMNRFFVGCLICLAAAGFLASQCMFFVGENQRALVLQLGEPVAPVRAPGLNFKLPFVQSVVTLENRILVFDIPKTYSLTAMRDQAVGMVTVRPEGEATQIMIVLRDEPRR